MSDKMVKQPEQMQFQVTDLVGNRIRPGDHKGHFDEAPSARIVVSGVEVAINDLLEANDGLLRACARMLHIEDGTVATKAMPPQADVDKAADGTVKALKHHAEKALRLADRFKEPDPVLRDARKMLRLYVKALRRVNIVKDSAPGLYIANQFSMAVYLLVGARSTDEGRATGIHRWEQALAKFGSMINIAEA